MLFSGCNSFIRLAGLCIHGRWLFIPTIFPDAMVRTVLAKQNSKQMKKQILTYFKHLFLTLLVLLVTAIVIGLSIGASVHYGDNPRTYMLENEGPYVFYENNTQSTLPDGRATDVGSLFGWKFINTELYSYVISLSFLVVIALVP